MNSVESISRIQQLIDEIEENRMQMIHTGMKHGFDDFRTIVLSQKLDDLLNKLP